MNSGVQPSFVAASTLAPSCREFRFLSDLLKVIHAKGSWEFEGLEACLSVGKQCIPRKGQALRLRKNITNKTDYEVMLGTSLYQSGFGPYWNSLFKGNKDGLVINQSSAGFLCSSTWLYWGCIGGCMGVMENKMETTIVLGYM